MRTRYLGSFEVSAIGLGCMPMSPGFGYNFEEIDPVESQKVMHRAIELGITLFDTADVYGPFTNEEVVGEYVVAKGLRDKIQLATKVGYILNDFTSYTKNARPDYIKTAIEGSLKRLRTDHVDLYQLHRVDPNVPIEESWGAMAELVQEGKVKHLGLSEVSVDEIKRAQTVHPVASVQSELSIWTSENVDNGVLDYCKANNIGFLAFSPLGRGFLTGTLSANDIKSTDYRSGNPRFQPEAMAQSQAIVAGIARIANRHEVTSAQLALAWVLAQGHNVVPIPGTKRLKWLEQNALSADIDLSEQDLADIAALPKPIAPRY